MSVLHTSTYTNDAEKIEDRCENCLRRRYCATYEAILEEAFNAGLETLKYKCEQGEWAGKILLHL